MYIFTAPAKAYETTFTFEGLDEFIRKGRSGSARMLGTTLEVRHASTGGQLITHVDVILYDTTVAKIYRDGRIEIPEAINRHGSQATTFWVQKALGDNRCGGFVAREDFKYSVAGQTFTRSI